MTNNEQPSLCLIADRFVDPRVAAKVEEAVQAGVERVQLRAHDAPDDEFAQAAEDLVERLRAIRPGMLITVNSRMEVAKDLGTAFHTGAHGPSLVEARKVLGDVVIGASAHTFEEARAAVEEGADYLMFSPVFATQSKPGSAPAGLGALALVVAAAVPVPVVALGGIGPDGIASCMRAGARGVAVLSGILRSPDVASAVAAYLEALSDSNLAR
jgi:thiamine-phosphate pyrophosphorylase